MFASALNERRNVEGECRYNYDRIHHQTRRNVHSMQSLSLRNKSILTVCLLQIISLAMKGKRHD
jgi:hypothetical protein